MTRDLRDEPYYRALNKSDSFQNPTNMRPQKPER